MHTVIGKNLFLQVLGSYRAVLCFLPFGDRFESSNVMVKKDLLIVKKPTYSKGGLYWDLHLHESLQKDLLMLYRGS